VNVAVQNLDASVTFFKAMGFQFNTLYTNEAAAGLVIDENIHVMLLPQNYFKTFTPKPLADARQNTEVLIALSCDSRVHVDTLIDKAVAAGGRVIRETNDHGFMYDRAFEDLDGHIWELAYMDMTALPPRE
jgi:predicted lactoylglutathione lyase